MDFVEPWDEALSGHGDIPIDNSRSDPVAMIRCDPYRHGLMLDLLVSPGDPGLSPFCYSYAGHSDVFRSPDESAVSFSSRTEVGDLSFPQNWPYDLLSLCSMTSSATLRANGLADDMMIVWPDSQPVFAAAKYRPWGFAPGPVFSAISVSTVPTDRFRNRDTRRLRWAILRLPN
jgi:hypothetical protein